MIGGSGSASAGRQINDCSVPEILANLIDTEKKVLGMDLHLHAHTKKRKILVELRLAYTSSLNTIEMGGYMGLVFQILFYRAHFNRVQR